MNKNNKNNTEGQEDGMEAYKGKSKIFLCIHFI